MVGRDGSFDRKGRFADSFSGLWSADGSAYAYTNDDTEDTTYWIRPLDGEALQLDTPSDVSEFRIVGWESAASVILWYFNDYSSTPKSWLAALLRDQRRLRACTRRPEGWSVGQHAVSATDGRCGLHRRLRGALDAPVAQ